MFPLPNAKIESLEPFCPEPLDFAITLSVAFWGLISLMFCGHHRQFHMHLFGRFLCAIFGFIMLLLVFGPLARDLGVVGEVKRFVRFCPA